MPSVKSLLGPAAKKDFEAILGSAYFSDDDAILSGYAWTKGISKVHLPEKSSRRFGLSLWQML